MRTAVVRQALPADGQPTVLDASGYVTARRQSVLFQDHRGIVDVLVEEGMAVTEGHVLAGLDDATERSYLTLAELEKRYEEARLDLDRQRRLLDLRLIGQAGLDGEGRGELARGTDRQPARAGWSPPSARSTCDGPPWRTPSSVRRSAAWPSRRTPSRER